MNDWADKMANSVLDNAVNEALRIFSQEGDMVELAKALRKAKAEGMREAANMVAARRGTVTIDVSHALTYRANQIEKGQE